MKYSFLLICFCITLPIFSQINSEYKIPSKEQLDTLKIQLETLFKKDQAFRKIYKEAEKKLGKDSFEMEYFWQIVEGQDKVLEKELSLIIDTYGWLGISQVGRLANTAQWAVLQHGPLHLKEKYAPLLKESVLHKESRANHYASLIDWMLINSNRLQMYGTAIKSDDENKLQFYDIKDPELINKRRKEIGLSSIQEFAKSKNMVWNIKQK